MRRLGDVGVRIDLRPAGLEVDARGPGVGHIVVGRQQLSGLAVHHIEEAVLGRVQQHRADLAADLQVGQHHGGGAVVVPLLGGDLLIVPGVFAGAGVHRHHRTQEQVVAAAGAAELLRVGRTVAGGEIDEVQLGIEGDGVPVVAAAAALPPLAAPGLGGRGHDGVRGDAVGLRRVAGDDVELPALFAGGRVIGGHVAARAEVAAGIADHHQAVGDARGAGDRQGLAGLERAGGPHRRPGAGVQRDQPPVQRRQIDLAMPGREAAADRAAAGDPPVDRRHLGIVGPFGLAARRVIGGDDVPGGDVVEGLADDQGRGLDAAIGVEVRVPGQAQPSDGAFVDLGQGAEALLGPGPGDRGPLPRRGVLGRGGLRPAAQRGRRNQPQARQPTQCPHLFPPSLRRWTRRSALV